jgi:hypothetical protein
MLAAGLDTHPFGHPSTGWCCMPNGGADCCGECVLNRAIQQLGSPHGKAESDRQEFWARSYCTLRLVKITVPFWTYCANYSHDDSRIPGAVPRGWIFASGVYEGYVRIPWHGDIEPLVGVSTICFICGRPTEAGIEVKANESLSLGFCSNRHYVRWWKTQHDDPSISEERYRDPDKAAKEAKPDVI